jgi:hypothetical protein
MVSHNLADSVEPMIPLIPAGEGRLATTHPAVDVIRGVRNEYSWFPRHWIASGAWTGGIQDSRDSGVED